MKKILLLLVAVFTAIGINAQELRMPKYKFLDNWSLSAGVGANMTFSDEYQSIKPQNWGPEVWLSLNKDWTPVLGNRFSIGWGQNNVCTIGEWNGTKEFLQQLALNPNRLSASVDFTINPLNLFNYNYDRKFNVLAIVGVGYAHLFEKSTTVNETTTSLKKNNFLVPKVGLQVNYKVSDPVLIFVESNFRVYDDKLDGLVAAAQYDADLTLTAGITYRFKNHDGTRGFNYILSYDQEHIDALNNEINSLREQLESKPNEIIVRDTVVMNTEIVNNISTPMTIRFASDSYVVSDDQLANLENLATFLKDNKSINVSIIGYSDAKTGTSEYNQQLSEKRAETVKNILVTKYNIDSERLTVFAKGDKVQQYSTNNWNRAVIITSNVQ